MLHGYKAWFANPKLHFLRLPRRRSLCDGAMHLCLTLLCKVSSLSSPGHGLLHKLYVEVRFFVLPSRSSLPNWIEPSPVLLPSSMSFDGLTYCTCLLYTAVKIILLSFVVVGLASCAVSFTVVNGGCLLGKNR